jgi:hypothetical protein
MSGSKLSQIVAKAKLDYSLSFLRDNLARCVAGTGHGAMGLLMLAWRDCLRMDILLAAEIASPARRCDCVR